MAAAPSIGSTARMSTALAGRPASVDDVETVVHAVDKVHVGQAGAARTSGRVARRQAEAGVRRPVLRSEVRLDLDDPADAPADAAVR